MSNQNATDNNTSSGYFITFEGGEGAGKSTQAKMLNEKLQQYGLCVLQTREPGGSIGAEDIRNLLVTGNPNRWSPTAETLLNYAARDDHLTNTIRPALKAKKIVICDRFMDSTRAYQGAAGGVRQSLIKHLEKEIIGPTTPDLTLIFDIDPDIGLARTHNRDHGHEDRYENKPKSFHQTLRRSFITIAENEPDRCVIINADQSPQDVASSIWNTVKTRLNIL